MTTAAEKYPKDFKCHGCGKTHEFPSYVYAHWYERLDFTCDCGQKVTINQGRVTLSKVKRGKQI